MIEKPLVSIFVPVFNHEPYLRQCLDGILCQQVSFNYEIIVHDDASTDKSVDIIREYSDKYPHIIRPVFEKEGQYAKVGDMLWPIRLKYANPDAKYVANCDGDDYWIDNFKLQKQVDFLESHSDFGLVATVCRSYIENEDKYYEPAKSLEKEITFKDLLFDDGFAASVPLFRKEFLKLYVDEIKEPWVSGDYSMWLFISAQSKIWRLADVTTIYRVLSSSVSHSRDFQKALDFKLNNKQCTLFFVEKYGVNKELKHIVYKNAAKNLLMEGIRTQYKPYIDEAIKYKKAHDLKVSLLDLICLRMLSNRFSKRVLKYTVQTYAILRKNVLNNFKR